MSSASIIPLSDQAALKAGGKARGLHLLLRAGMRVPDGFVVPDAPASLIEEELRVYLSENFEPEGSAFAVRSSGLDEDSFTASFAGQYETILNVRGFDAIRAAIRVCREAASSKRVSRYASARANGAISGIPVIVQRMVDARLAGVVFTADPVSNRRDRVIIDAVSGLGENLVAGQRSGEHHVLSRAGRPISFSSEYASPLLSPDQVERLREESLRIEGFCGFPADLEWAIDAEGALHWLQLRPITTLAPVHLNELDYRPSRHERHLLTRCNVGEMMPGPVTPLSWSVFGRGIDVGLQDFVVRIGVLDRIREENRFIFMFYNHLFIDMTALYEIPRKVAFTTKGDVDASICGHPVPGPAAPFSRPLLVRIVNFLRYIIYFTSATRRLRKLRRLVASFSIPVSDDCRGTYRAIDARLPLLFEAWAHHYATSAKSGTLNAALIRILESDGAGTTQDHLGALTGLLTGLGGINGALALEELEGIRDAIRDDPWILDAFLHETGEKCLKLLQGPGAGRAGRLFRVFLRRHGHRCVREAELRESDWESNPGALVRLLQRGVALTTTGTERDSRGDRDELCRYSGRTRFIVRRVLPSVRRFVVARENSKSLCVRMQSRFKKAYRRLGELLVGKGLLDDIDQVFFLTHQELGDLVEKPGPLAKAKAQARRDLYPSLFDLRFEDFSWDTPEPIEAHLAAPVADGVLRGVPVSAGTVTGPARVINSLSDAETLSPGEIMIASYTDIGWTPFFASISGLVTEIGSTLSHGAVVAREYGIPAVVGVSGAKERIRTGDTITIDGKRGIIEVHGKPPRGGKEPLPPPARVQSR